MTFDWNRATVGDFVDLQRGNTYQSKLLDAPGPVLLGLGSIERDGGFRADKLRTYGGESPVKLLVYPGDMYVSLKDVTQSGDLLGSIARVPASITVGRMTQDTVRLIPKNELIDRSYLYWVLRSPEYREYCRARGMGTTNLSLSRGDFLSFPVPEPTVVRLLIQKSLDAIEERSSLNRSINQTLEALAQAIFKSWFVDFDPVKAKIAAIEQGLDPLRAAMCAISGKTDAELDQISRKHHDQLASTAALFPEAMEELEDIPKGWEVSTIGEMVEIAGGATPDTKNELYWNPPEHFWTSPKDLSGAQSPVLLATERRISNAGLARIGSGLLPKGTLLMSSRAPIGYLAITQIPVAINQGYIAMLPGGKLPPLYLLMWCQHNMEKIKGQANGSTFLEISKKAFRPMPVIYPGSNLTGRFVEAVTPLFEQLVARVKESSQLAKLRDALLPRLFSGDLTVPPDLNDKESR